MWMYMRALVAIEDLSGLHSGWFHSEWFLLCVKKQGDGFGREEDVVRGILEDDAMFVMELEVFEAELHSTSVGCHIYMYS